MTRKRRSLIRPKMAPPEPETTPLDAPVRPPPVELEEPEAELPTATDIPAPAAPQIVTAPSVPRAETPTEPDPSPSPEDAPDTPDQDVSEPGVSEPDVSEPDVSEPDADELPEPVQAANPAPTDPAPPAPTPEQQPAHLAFPALPPAHLASPMPPLPIPELESPEAEPGLAPVILPSSQPSAEAPAATSAPEVPAQAAPPPAMAGPPRSPAPPTGDPATIERAVHGALHDAAYTVPQVPETLRRFDAVTTTDSFAGRVETSVRLLEFPGIPPRAQAEPPVPDVRFTPKPPPPPPQRSSVPWLGITVILFAILSIGVALVFALTRPDELSAAVTEGIDPSLAPSPAVAPIRPPPSEPPIPRSVSPRSPPPSPPTEPLVQSRDAGPAPAPRTRPAKVNVRSNKRALVYLDGRAVGLTPEVLELPPGTYEVQVMQPGQPATRQARTIEVGAGGKEALYFNF